MYEISRVAKCIEWAHSFIPINVPGWEDCCHSNHETLSDEFDETAHPWKSL